MTQNSEFHPGERLWLCGREVTFVAFSPFEYQRSARAALGAAVIRHDGERHTRDVPLSILARDRDESVVRASAIPAELTRYFDAD